MQQLKESTPEDKALKSKKMQPEWKKVKLGEIASFRTGPFGSALHKSDYIENGIPLINPMHIIDGQIVPSDSMTVPEHIAKKLNDFRLEAGEIIIGRRGDMGRCAVVKAENKGWLCGTGSMIVRGATKKVVPEYLQRVLSSPSVVAAIEESSVGSTMINLNQGTLSNLDILLPSYVEQSKIANALIDTDTLIISLEKLIAKKRAIKTASMQQLLTGKKRLPPFDKSHAGYKQTELGEIPEDWDVDLLSNVLSITTGDKNTQDKVEDGQFPFFVRSQTVESINSYSFDGEAVLTAGDGVGTGKIYHYINGKCDFHQRVYLMHNFSSRLNGYYFYIYFSNNFYDRIMNMTAKSSVDSVRREMIANMKIALPSFAEQLQISECLSVMDHEVVSLEQRLNKSKQIKQGMMQELLTGKTRLVAGTA